MAQDMSTKPVTIAPSSFTPLEQAAPKAPVPRKAGRMVLFFCLALFILLMLFLLSARSLMIEVTAQAPAKVSVSGLALPFGKRYLLRPGEYDIRVTAKGYHPLTTTATSATASLSRYSFSLCPVYSLSTVSRPAPASSSTVTPLVRPHSRTFL
jgi:hypothetical protein